MAIENLDSTSAQRANALETLEAVGDPALVRPLLVLWEPKTAPANDGEWLAGALLDDDPFIRLCAELVRARREGDTMKASAGAISLIERVLFLRQVPLFADLTPADVERVAEIAEERGYADGETIAAEGELGNELHIVVEGVVSVIQDRDGTEHELARRTAGDGVGEMSLITHTPRIASLVASGPVRTIRIGHWKFEQHVARAPRRRAGGHAGARATVDRSGSQSWLTSEEIDRCRSEARGCCSTGEKGAPRSCSCTRAARSGPSATTAPGRSPRASTPRARIHSPAALREFAEELGSPRRPRRGSSARCASSGRS